jgi:peptidylprolyl isomerase
MAGSKHNRQRVSRQERLRAEAEARRKEARRRTLRSVGTATAVLVVVIGVVVLLRSGGSKKASVAVNGATTTIPVPSSISSSTTLPAPSASAAGKPCVAVADPLPSGSPAVPVRVGAPLTTLVTQDLKVGTGAVVTAADSLTVRYIGVACSTGKIFDSSYSRGQPATFALSGVIKGWQEGIPGMKVGGERLLGIPSSDAYGAQGSPPAIAPDEALWFVVEVIDAKPA